MSDKELKTNAYCTECQARIPVYELMCSSCKRKFPTKASRTRICTECGKPYFAAATAEQLAQEFSERKRGHE